MMDILVTGGAGYLGSALLKNLAENKEINRLTVFDNFSKGNKIAFRGIHSAKLRVIDGDILNTSDLKYALSNIDTVLHLAAVAHTPLASFDEQAVSRVNIWGTESLLKALEQHPIKKFILISSIAVYGARDEYGVKSFNLGAYSKTKRIAEEKVLTFAKRNNIIIEVLRFGTLYGLAPVINFDSFVNKMAFDAALNERCIILGSGKQERAITSIPLAVASCEKAILEMSVKTSAYDVYDKVVTPEEIGKIIQSFFGNVQAYYTDQDVRTRYSFLPEGEKKMIKEIIPYNEVIKTFVEEFKIW